MKYRRLKATADAVYALADDEVHLFEYHPFTKDLYRTANCGDIPGYDYYTAAGIPNSPRLLANIVRTESTLLIYDLKKAKIIDQQPVDLNSMYALVCSQNAIAVSGNRPKVVVFAWNGSKLKSGLPLEGLPTVLLSESSMLAYRSANTINFFPCTDLEADDAAEPSRNAAEPSRNTAESSRNGA